MDHVIETSKLTKRYGRATVVDGLDLEVRVAEVFGFLGPNGAGKSTTILMLLGLTEPTAGAARVLGFDPSRQPVEVKRRVGYMPEHLGFYHDMTGYENLEYVARLNDLPAAEARSRMNSVLEKVKLADEGQKPAGAYSRGMRQRLGIAEVLIKEPQLVILDEPTLGLDPEGIAFMLKLIRSLKEEGISVVLCSHLLYQVQEVCDRVGILNKGKLVAAGTIQDLAAAGLDAQAGKLSLDDVYMRYFREDQHAHGVS